MPTQGVLSRQRVGKALAAAARTHAHPVGEHIQTHLPFIAGDQPDWIGLQLVLAGHLEACLDALSAADAQHRAEIDAAPEARLQRDRFTRELYVSVRDLRAGFTGVLGRAEGDRLLGIRGETARRPKALLRQARRVVERLHGPLAELPTQVSVDLPGFETECARVADRIEIGIDRLQRAMAEVEEHLEQRRRTRAIRSAALAACDRAVRGIGRVLKGCYALAGFPELARKVRFDVKASIRAKGGV